MGIFDLFKGTKKVKYSGTKKINCPECGRTLGTEDEIRAMIDRSMGGMFGPGTSTLSFGGITTDCPYCHKKIPLSV